MNYYSRKEVANILGCSATKVSNLVKKLPKEIKEKNIKVRKSKNGRDTWGSVARIYTGHKNTPFSLCSRWGCFQLFVIPLFNYFSNFFNRL